MNECFIFKQTKLFEEYYISTTNYKRIFLSNLLLFYNYMKKKKSKILYINKSVNNLKERENI